MISLGGQQKQKDYNIYNYNVFEDIFLKLTKDFIEKRIGIDELLNNLEKFSKDGSGLFWRVWSLLIWGVLSGLTIDRKYYKDNLKIFLEKKEKYPEILLIALYHWPRLVSSDDIDKFVYNTIGLKDLINSERIRFMVNVFTDKVVNIIIKSDIIGFIDNLFKNKDFYSVYKLSYTLNTLSIFGDKYFKDNEEKLKYIEDAKMYIIKNIRELSYNYLHNPEFVLLLFCLDMFKENLNLRKGEERVDEDIELARIARVGVEMQRFLRIDVLQAPLDLAEENDGYITHTIRYAINPKIEEFDLNKIEKAKEDTKNGDKDAADFLLGVYLLTHNRLRTLSDKIEPIDEKIEIFCSNENNDKESYYNSFLRRRWSSIIKVIRSTDDVPELFKEAGFYFHATLCGAQVGDLATDVGVPVPSPVVLAIFMPLLDPGGMDLRRGSGHVRALGKFLYMLPVDFVSDEAKEELFAELYQEDECYSEFVLDFIKSLPPSRHRLTTLPFYQAEQFLSYLKEKYGKIKKIDRKAEVEIGSIMAEKLNDIITENDNMLFYNFKITSILKKDVTETILEGLINSIKYYMCYGDFKKYINTESFNKYIESKYIEYKEDAEMTKAYSIFTERFNMINLIIEGHDTIFSDNSIQTIHRINMNIN